MYYMFILPFLQAVQVITPILSSLQSCEEDQKEACDWPKVTHEAWCLQYCNLEKPRSAVCSYVNMPKRYILEKALHGHSVNSEKSVEVNEIRASSSC